jgi:uncharacterized spore protein YtfJ
MENYISSKTVVGEPISVDGIVIVPLVDVSFGVGAGVHESKGKETTGSEYGGGALGGKITPAAILVINDGNVELINIKSQDGVMKLIDMVPGIVSKLNLSSIFKKKPKKDDVDIEFEETKVTEKFED